MIPNKFKFFISIIIPLFAGFIGSLFTSPNIESWYDLLNRPSIAPPSWVFGPVWSILFLLMGIALYIVWTKTEKKEPYILFGFQLVFNILWSYIFFGLQNPIWAFAEILVLLFLIIITTLSFWKVDKKAGILMIPYIIWVLFAALLNYSFYLIN